MMANITSNQDIEFRLFSPSELVSMYQMDQRLYVSISKASIPQESSYMVLSDQSKDGWVAHIREEFYSVPEVEAIYVAIDENNIDIWLLIPNRDICVVRQLAEIEMKILERFISLEQPLFLLDFHVVYRCGADESQFVPQRAIRLRR